MKKILFMFILMHLLFLSISVNALQLDDNKIFDNLDDSLLYEYGDNSFNKLKFNPTAIPIGIVNASDSTNTYFTSINDLPSVLQAGRY